MAINNINESWNNHTGLDVEDFIKGQLNNKLSTSTNPVKEIKTEEGKAELHVYYTNDSGTNVDEDGKHYDIIPITVVAPSENQIKINIDEEYSSILTLKGKTILIPYSYTYVKNETEVIPGQKARITIKKGNTVIAEVDPKTIGTVTSSLTPGLWRKGTINIDSSLLSAGDNTLTLEFIIPDVPGLQPATRAITITVIDLKLDVSVNSETLTKMYYDPVAPDEQFNLKFTVTGNLGYDVTKEIYYGTTLITQTTMSDYSTTINGVLSGSNITNTFYIRAYVADGEKKIGESNIVGIRLAVTGRLNQFSMKFYPSEINSSVFKVDTLQYEQYPIQFLTYGSEGLTIQETIGGEVIGDVKNVANNNIITFPYTPKVPGYKDVNIKVKNEGTGVVTNLFTYTFNVISNGSGIFEPDGAKISLSAAGRTSSTRDWTSGAYSTEFIGFNWQGNGFDGNALVLNTGATAVINYPVCSTNTYAFSVKLASQYSIENEAIVSCLENGYGFEIYPEKVIAYNGADPLIAEFNASDFLGDPVEHTVGIVRHGSNYLNLVEIYIDGEIAVTQQASSYWTHNKPITLRADKSDIKIYNIYAYDKAISFTGISALHGLNLDSSEKVNSYVRKNNIFDIDDTQPITYYTNNVTIDKLPVGSTYVVISSYGNNDLKPWETINSYDGSNGETLKGVRHLVGNVKLIHKTADGSADPRNFCVNRATLSAQGTSSMFYPIKNYRFYFKKVISSDQPYYNSASVYGTDGKEGDLGYSSVFYTNVTPDFELDPTDDNGVILKGSGTKKKSVKTKGVINEETQEEVQCTYPASIKYSLFTKELDGYEYDSAPAKLFCLKADYAESSGSHNTGFARMVDYVSKKSSDISMGYDKGTHPGWTPQQKYQSTYEYDIRTTIDGRPVYLFFKYKDGDQDKYVYSGKFNINNEKSSEDVFGFQGCGDYYNNEKVRTESTNLINLFTNAINKAKAKGTTSGFEPQGNTTTKDVKFFFEAAHQKYGIKMEDGKPSYDDGLSDFYNPNECWEFSTNSIVGKDAILNGKNYNNLGAFQYPYTMSPGYPKYNTALQNHDPFTAKNSKNELVWLNYNDGLGNGDTSNHGEAWEYRFPGWETKEDTSGLKSQAKEKAHQLYLGKYAKDKDGADTGLNGVYAQPYLLKSLYKWLYKHNVTLLDADTEPRIMGEFASQLHLYFNLNFLIKYFVLTHWFGNTDQRIKNCMLAFYCDPDADNTGATENGQVIGDEECPLGHMRAYYIFYDNDTILGVDNNGDLTNQWNIDEGAFPGSAKGNESHAIWNGLQYCYNAYINGSSDDNINRIGKMIENAYSNLRTNLEDPFEFFDNAYDEMYGQAAYNVDTQLKRYRPSFLNKDRVTEPYDLTKEQGRRKAHRHKWLNKRTIWLDTKFGAQSYIDYSYKFKVGEPEGQSLTYGPIYLTPAINNWKFYMKYQNEDLDNTLSKNVVPANTPVTLTIPQGKVTISDYVTLAGLYGCSRIDMSDLTIGNYVAGLTSKNKLPYLKQFILNQPLTENPKKKGFSTTAFKNLVSNGGEFLFPNLEDLYICNLVPYVGGQSSETNDGVVGATTNTNARFDKLDLSKNHSIKIINALGTPIDITLPSGETLTTLILQNPTDLSIVNKRNLSNFDIKDVSKLLKIEVENVHSSVYKWALTTALDFENASVLSNVTINFRNGDNVYTISNNELLNLKTLAELIKNNQTNGRTFVIKGSIYCPSITDDQKLVEYKDLFDQVFGDSLLLVADQSEEFKLTSDGTSLNEGSNITFYSNRLLATPDDWEWKIGESVGETLAGKISVVKTKTKITFNLEGQVDNSEISSDDLVVTAYLNKGDLELQETAESNIIPIISKPITGLQISFVEGATQGAILKENTPTKVIVTGIPVDNTKQAYINRGVNNASNWIMSGFGTIKGLDGLETPLQPNGTMLDGKFTLTGKNTTLLQLNIDGIESNTVKIIYDMHLATINPSGTSAVEHVSLTDAAITAYGLKDSKSLEWIWYFLTSQTGTANINKYANVYVSTLNQFNLDSYYQNSAVFKPQYGDTQDGSTLNNSYNFEYDFEFIQFCGFVGNTFNIWGSDSNTIQGMRFTKLTLPENIRFVNWNCNISDWNGYGKIKFGRNIESIKIDLSTPSSLSNLQFDMSECDNITSIQNYSGLSVPFGVASFKINVDNLTETTVPQTPIFVYPKNLRQLGNYNSLDDTINYPQSCIFTRSNSSGNSVAGFGTSVVDYTATYNVPAHITNILNVGVLFSYKTVGTTLNQPSSNINSTYYTFYKGSILPNGNRFSAIESIGNLTFCESSSDVTISNNVKAIGNLAFNNYTGTLSSSSVVKGIDDFKNVQFIGDNAFSYMILSKKFAFDSSKLKEGFNSKFGVGSDAFTVNSDSSVSHDIYIYGSDAFTCSTTSFGEYKKHNLHITQALANALKTALGNNYEILSNNVNIIIELLP